MGKIEDEIKQKSFKSEYHKLTVNLLFTNSWLLNCHKNIFSNYNITIAQYNILRILRGQHPNPISINSLQDRMIEKMSDTSRLVERLRVKGYVKRKECDYDRRKSEITITNSGLKLLRELDFIDKKFEELLSSITVEEAKRLNKLLDKLRG